MPQPKFTKITTGGHPAYRFEHDGKTFRAYRYASGAGAWNVDRIDGEQRTPVVRGRDTRAAAVAAVIDAPKDEQPNKLDELAADLEQQNADADELLADIRALGPEVDALEGEVAEWGAKVDALTEPSPAGEPVEYFVEVASHVQARPRVYEDRFAIFQRGLADPIERFALPYRSDRSDRDTLALRGWSIVGELDYVAGLNVSRGRVERTPVQYGNAGHWISAHVVDPSAGVPAETGYVAVAKCGDYLIATYDTPRGHALCVACTGDPVEIISERDRTGWLKDGGRPVKVLRALSHHDRIIATVVTTDVKGAAREWHDVRIDATAPEIIFAPEQPATREEISAGTLVEAVVISNRPTVQQCRVDRAPWGGDRDTILTDGRYIVAVWTDSLRVVEQPAEAPQPAPPPGGLRDMCLNALCTKDYGHTRRDGDECGDVFSTAGGGGPRSTPVADEPALPGEPCKHGRRLRPGATLSIRCDFGNTYGVFGDEGPLETNDCAVEAANSAADYAAEDDGDTTYVVRIICPDHEEQPADSCEECFAEPVAD
ncbi:hypothetical protein [Streptomyces sp. NPDC006355]|uniref:hypothetical protein n=1 Tax=Streptomyces sp. NPDC006355 TaxID=3156758 RepID=UPI0033BD7727